MADEQSDSRGEARQSFFAKQLLINEARTAFQQLQAVFRNSIIYPEAHPFLLTSAAKLLGTLERLLVGRKEVGFYLVGGELFFETYSVLLDPSLALFMEEFVRRGVGSITFKPGLLQSELIRFAMIFGKESGAPPPLAVEDLEAFTNSEISHIDLHKVLIVDKKTSSALKEGKKKAGEVFMNAVDAVKEMVQAVHLDKAVSARKMNTVVQTMVDNILDNRDAFMGLTSIKMYDEYTFAHSVNTSILAVGLGTFLSFDKPQLAALGMAAMLHDIGKVSIPIDIINKPSKLTDAEWEMVKRHPIEGALILADVPGVTKLAMVSAFEHHQHGDIRGYPRIDEIVQQHPFSQIVALCDAYEALTAARVYYSVQMPPDQAIRILIKKRGTAFDPTLVKVFVNMVGIFPVGTVLKLDTGQVGLVVRQTRDLMRPHVLLLTKFDGSEKENGDEVSLLETANGRYKRSVVGIIDPYASKIDMRKYLT